MTKNLDYAVEAISEHVARFTILACSTLPKLKTRINMLHSKPGISPNGSGFLDK